VVENHVRSRRMTTVMTLFKMNNKEKGENLKNMFDSIDYGRMAN